jgi:cyclopropane fatty-acyl-phospholipid synthase-like methyltransferase
MAPARFSAHDIRGADQGYVAYHAPRFAYVLEVLDRCGLGTGSTVLDIGPSRLTALIRERFGVAVDSLGFGEDRAAPEGRHFEFDLNQAQRQEGWRRDLPRYDFVVMAEVLEHLHTAPQLVLGFVRTLLADGGRLILQTPNAASLPKRLKLLLGRNPFEMIRADAMNPGHFREYTRKELLAIAADTGFRVEECTVSFYFDARFAHRESGEAAGRRAALGSLKNAVYRLLPSPLREGITMVWRTG